MKLVVKSYLNVCKKAISVTLTNSSVNDLFRVLKIFFPVNKKEKIQRKKNISETQLTFSSRLVDLPSKFLVTLEIMGA